MKKKYYIYIVLLLFINTISAQQDAQFTHYMYNMNIVNPAYTTDDFGTINMGLLHRRQWVGIDGESNSTTAFVHTPLISEFELGLSFINDNIDNIVNENNIYADIAYKVRISNKSTLSLGIKGGVRLFDTGFGDFNLQSGNSNTDPNFKDISNSFFNIGAGIYFNTDNFYLGLSAPSVLEKKYSDLDGNITQSSEKMHYFLTSGYVFSISEGVKFKPSFLVKYVHGAPLSYDVNANLLFGKVEFGVGYRIDDAVSGVINFNVFPKLRIGYSYDYTLSNLKNFNSGSHEILVLFNIDTFNKRIDKSPRFF